MLRRRSSETKRFTATPQSRSRSTSSHHLLIPDTCLHRFHPVARVPLQHQPCLRNGRGVLRLSIIWRFLRRRVWWRQNGNGGVRRERWRRDQSQQLNFSTSHLNFSSFMHHLILSNSMYRLCGFSSHFNLSSLFLSNNFLVTHSPSRIPTSHKRSQAPLYHYENARLPLSPCKEKGCYRYDG